METSKHVMTKNVPIRRDLLNVSIDLDLDDDGDDDDEEKQNMV